MSAGQVVQQAIAEWAENHPEALVVVDSASGAEFVEAVECLKRGIAEQARLIRELQIYFKQDQALTTA